VVIVAGARPRRQPFIVDGLNPRFREVTSGDDLDIAGQRSVRIRRRWQLCCRLTILVSYAHRRWCHREIHVSDSDETIRKLTPVE